MIVNSLRIFAVIIALTSTQSYTTHLGNKFKPNRTSRMHLNSFASFFNKKPSPVPTQTSILIDEKASEIIIVELRNKLFQEIDDYKSGFVSSYNDHNTNINSIVSKLPTSAINDSLTDSFFTTTNKYQLDYLSTPADDNKADNTNVNDKIWKLGLKIATVTKEIDIKNPSTFYVTMKFTDFCVIRYIYNLSNTSNTPTATNKNPSKVNIKYLEFQWFVFGRLTYNRLINRNEIWTILFRDDDSILFDISDTASQSDEEEVKEYERKVLFRKQ